MSVAFVTPRYPPYIGGVETHVSELATRTQARFDNVSVVTTDPLGHLPRIEWTHGGLTIYRVRSFAPSENFHFPEFQGFIRSLRQCRSQVLHLHSIHDVPGPLAGFLGSGSRLVFTPHFGGSIFSTLGKLFFAAYRSIIHELIGKVDAIICVSSFEAACMKNAFPESDGKIHVIPNGVDIDRSSKHPWKEPETPTILFAGRLEQMKNVDKVLLAFAELRKRDSAVRLIMVGRGPLKQKLKQLSSSLAVGESVEWIDGVTKDRLYQLYSSSTVVVVPSEFECYGLVAAEAISTGAPTIVANSTALSDFVTEGLAEPIEVPVTRDKLVEKISKVLEDPRAFRHGQKQSSILSWDEVAALTWTIYDSLRAR